MIIIKRTRYRYDTVRFKSSFISSDAMDAVLCNMIIDKINHFSHLISQQKKNTE